MTIALLDGRRIDVGAISFNESSYQFFFRSENITNLIRRADKNNFFPEFDPNKDNARLSTGNPNSELSTSTLGFFTEQILTEPLNAPLDALDNGVKKIFDSPGIRTILIWAVVLIGIGLFVWVGGLSRIRGIAK